MHFVNGHPSNDAYYVGTAVQNSGDSHARLENLVQFGAINGWKVNNTVPSERGQNTLSIAATNAAASYDIITPLIECSSTSIVTISRKFFTGGYVSGTSAHNCSAN